jgi:hypothetical protein
VILRPATTRQRKPSAPLVDSVTVVPTASGTMPGDARMTEHDIRRRERANATVAKARAEHREKQGGSG